MKYEENGDAEKKNYFKEKMMLEVEVQRERERGKVVDR